MMFSFGLGYLARAPESRDHVARTPIVFRETLCLTFADQSKYFEPETSSGLSELRERKLNIKPLSPKLLKDPQELETHSQKPYSPTVLNLARKVRV